MVTKIGGGAMRNGAGAVNRRRRTIKVLVAGIVAVTAVAAIALYSTANSGMSSLLSSQDRATSAHSAPASSAPAGSTPSGAVPSKGKKASTAEIRATQIAPQPGHVVGHLAIEDALPAVSISSSAVIDTTDGLMSAFANDLALARLGPDPSGKQVARVTATRDECLQSWAMSELPKMEGQSTLGSQSVCGRDATVLAGGYGLAGMDLIGRVSNVPTFAPLQAMLFHNDNIAYASVATGDGNGVLIAVAPKVP